MEVPEAILAGTTGYKLKLSPGIVLEGGYIVKQSAHPDSLYIMWEITTTEKRILDFIFHDDTIDFIESDPEIKLLMIFDSPWRRYTTGYGHQLRTGIVAAEETHRCLITVEYKKHTICPGDICFVK